MIVHEQFQKQALTNDLGNIDGLDEKISVIPHGARELDDIIDAKTRLGIDEDTKIVLMIGYFSPYKNFEKVIDLWPEIVAKYNGKVVLIIAGKLRTMAYLEYRNLLFERINSSPAKDNIKVIRGQISQNSFDIILSAADVVVLPYKKISQSGIFANCMSFGKPVVTSYNKTMESIFSEYKSGLMCKNDHEYVENILYLLKDEKKFIGNYLTMQDYM